MCIVYAFIVTLDFSKCLKNVRNKEECVIKMYAVHLRLKILSCDRGKRSL